MERKVKNLLGTIVLIASVFQLFSCSSESQYAENEDVKTFVLWNCVDSNYLEEMNHKWIAEVWEGKIKVTGYEKAEEENGTLNLFGACCVNFLNTITSMNLRYRLPEGTPLQEGNDFNNKNHFFKILDISRVGRG